MKSIFDKKITVAILFFFAGMGVQWSLQKMRDKSAQPASFFSKKISDADLDQIFDQDYESNFS